MKAKGWKVIALGEFVTLQRGHDLPEHKRHPGNVPILGSFGVTGFHDEAKSSGPGVTVGRSGASFGIVTYSPADFWPLNTALYVIDFHGNDKRFAYYFLRQFDFKRYNSGSAQPSLNRNYVHPLLIEVPPVPEQRAIAHILGTLDDKIELNHKMNETLEAIAQALFKSWFVDFEPVRAKTEGCDTGLPKHIADLFPESFEDSPLGPIPNGWMNSRLNAIVEIISGGTPKTSVSAYWNGDVPWFSIGDTPRPGDVFVIDTDKKISQSGLENSSTTILPLGTTIISARGTVGNLALVGVPIAMNQSCYGLRGACGYGPYYTYFSIVSLIDMLRKRTHGSVFDTITRDTFSTIDAIMPPTHISACFEEVVSPYLERILVNLHLSRTLASIRDALLPKLLSGEIRVKDAERFAESRL